MAESQSVKVTSSRGGSPSKASSGSGGPFKRYKPEQGKMTRMGTIFGLGAFAAWGGYFLNQVIGPGEPGSLKAMLLSMGVPIVIFLAVVVVSWWVVFAKRSSGDFLIATEGEMKKVSWSTTAEVIGSTKVVIVFTLLMALLLFGVDIVWQFLMRTIGLLKGGG